MKTIFILLAASALLFGCASTDYKLYAESQTAMQVAKSNAEAAKYAAMAEIAKQGDVTVKVAAMMAMVGQGGANAIAPRLEAPVSGSEMALKWATILVPSTVQAVGIVKNAQVAVQQSNNARDVALSTNESFVGIAGKIQAPAANVSTDSHDSSSTTSSVTDSHNTSKTDSHNTASTVDSHNTASTVDSHAVDSHATDSHNSDDHTTNPAVQVVTPPGMLCTVGASGVLDCNQGG